MSFPRQNLGDLTQIRTGKLDANASSDDGEYPFFTCASKPLRISSYSYDCECALVAGNGDLNVKYYKGKFDAYQRTYIVQARPEVDGKLHIRYIYHFLETYLETLREQSIGGIIKYIKLGNLTGAQIPLPPLAEQKRIAGILDAADALRAKRRESLAQLDTLLQSTFLDMFGDPVTNPMGWSKKSLGELALKKPNNGVFRKNPEYSGSDNRGLPVVWVEELFRGNSIDVRGSRRLEATDVEIEKYGLDYGDILFCRSSLKRDGIAYNNVYLGDSKMALFECHLIRISPDTGAANPVFLNLQLRTVPMRAVLKSKSKTATMTTIDQKALSSVEVVVPPIKLQDHFAALVDSVERQKERFRRHLAELDALFASLQSRAFTGEL